MLNLDVLKKCYMKKSTDKVLQYTPPQDVKDLKGIFRRTHRRRSLQTR